MSFWVHASADGRPWYAARSFTPPVGPVPGKGYPRFFVEIEKSSLYFASLWEMREFIQTLAKRVLPTSRVEANRHFAGQGTVYAPGGHWLSRIPPALLPWRRRQRAVQYLSHAYAEFQQTIRSEHGAGLISPE